MFSILSCIINNCIFTFKLCEITLLKSLILQTSVKIFLCVVYFQHHHFTEDWTYEVCSRFGYKTVRSTSLMDVHGLFAFLRVLVTTHSADVLMSVVSVFIQLAKTKYLQFCTDHCFSYPHVCTQPQTLKVHLCICCSFNTYNSESYKTARIVNIYKIL